MKQSADQLRVGLIIAHPDDEAMFFTPLMRTLSRKHHVFVLCLSNGNYEGLGKIREKELQESCSILVSDVKDVTVLDDELLQDGPLNEWPSQHVADVVIRYTREHNLDMLYTFDKNGVSGHNNHKATFHGVKVALNSLREKGEQSEFPAYALISTSIWQKFLGPLDALLTGEKDDVFFNDLVGIGHTWKAMWAHWSQFVWFRILFLAFSRYVYVNTFTPI
eukprot:m.225366 g.225366  ORF g.225366 m.225366 type:complete len:220 (+) comp15956_c0_seq3:109-768(+)